jgi:hypothetical protein
MSVSTSTLQFISQVKLGELRRQRALLVDAYDALNRACAGKTDVEALKTLFDGLQKIKVAGTRLHSDLGNIELLMQGTAPSAEIVAFWRRRLEGELATGRLRADIVYLFGALLGEWGDEGASRQAFLDERREAHTSLLEQVTTPVAQAEQGDHSLLNEIFAGFGAALQSVPGKVAHFIAKWLERETYAVSGLATIAGSIYQPSAIRREAKRFLDDGVLNSQYEDALRVATRDLGSWSWPKEGVAIRALWTRNKWRLYLDLSLVQLSIVNSFGHFWSQAIAECFSDAARKINRLSRYHKLVDLNAPEVIVENERRMLRQEEERIDFGWYESIDPWDGTPAIPADQPVQGIVSRRAAEQGALRESGGGAYYGGYGANHMISLVHAEVRTLRAAFPERPLFLARLDIRDYFASLPHDVLLAMLRGLGLTAHGLDAVGRFLAIPYRVDGRIVTAQRGVPMDQHLSHWLAEWLLRLMERYVHGCAKVRILRQIDDICLLAPSAEDVVAAWRAVRRFLQACGLDLNQDKCGACALGGALPRELPQTRPRWGLLELTDGGDWGVHEPTFQTFCEHARQRASARHALLTKVTLYNAHLRFLSSAIGLALDLGDAHRQSVNDVLRRFDGEFFRAGLGIVEGLRQSIQDRYLAGTQLSHLPEGWMYWPITAGGLSLRSAFVLASQHMQALEQRKTERVSVPSVRPANWQQGDAAWTAFYDDQLKTIKPAEPQESKLMKTLVDDFITRGKEISAGKQQGLSGYWRWILCLYGPEILEKFGTFRFLLTDLVPLQLIHERLLEDNSLEGQ